QPPAREGERGEVLPEPEVVGDGARAGLAPGDPFKPARIPRADPDVAGHGDERAAQRDAAGSGRRREGGPRARVAPAGAGASWDDREGRDDQDGCDRARAHRTTATLRRARSVEPSAYFTIS